MNDDDLRHALDDLLAPLPPLGALPAGTARRATRRRRLKLAAAGAGGAGVLVLAAALAATAGGGGEEELRPAPFATPSSSPTGSPTASPGATAAPSGPTQTEQPAEPVDVSVVLRPDGLGFTDGGSASSSLAFGSDADTVRTAVDRALGGGGDVATPDCGAEVVTRQYEGLFLLLDGDRFVGWVTGSPGLTTGDGIGVGATLADLRAAYPGLTVTESTLGVEWSSGGDLFGFLDGPEETSRVTNVLAGQACLAR